MIGKHREARCRPLGGESPMRRAAPAPVIGFRGATLQRLTSRT